MVISEPIAELEKLKEEHGDLHIYVYDGREEIGEFDIQVEPCREWRKKSASDDNQKILSIG